MEFKVQLLLLGLCMSFSAGDVYEEVDLTDNNGEIIHVTKEMKPNCRFQKYTSEYGDNIHIVVNDFDKGISLVVMSEKPEVCYVREITPEEEAAVKNCVNGALRDKQVTSSRKEKEYEVGEDTDSEKLPATVKDLCKGRKVLLMYEKTEIHPSDDTSKPKVKRACREVVTYTTDQICNYVCQGWWLGKKCENVCNSFQRPNTRVVC